MAQRPYSLVLLRCLSLSCVQAPQTPNRFRTLILCAKHFSNSPLHRRENESLDLPKPSSLSARMSFVFDQIDAIEKQRFQQDQTLQRIRAWRQSKQTLQEQHNTELFDTKQLPGLELEPSARNNADADSKLSTSADLADSSSGELKKEKGSVELVHPWPEWIELMERLVQQNYFDHRRSHEDKLVQGLGIDVSEVVGGDILGIDFFKDFKTVQTACLNFGKDRFDILRSLSRQDIQILVGYGCPSADKKVVFSAKLLRKHVHLDEGDVCSSCSLRTSCERAYLLTNKEDEARTIDVMRVLTTYGFDPLNGSVINNSLLKHKSVKTVVRKLLHEVVKLSAVPIDPNLPPPIIKKPPPKVKQPPPPPKKRVGRDDIEMKKGDWLCPKCDFMNFAKNTICLQCDAKRPKRQLLPGEWECPECNFLNYRRNMTCFHCDCKRPAEEFVDDRAQEKQHGFRAGVEKVASRAEVSNTWNFDFDDDESDGADVAAFEYADSSAMGKGSLDSRGHGGNFRGPEDDFDGARRVQRVNERGYSDHDRSKPGLGFDDFDDEDDIDSYEIDTQKNTTVRRASPNDFSEGEGFSESEDTEGSDHNSFVRHGKGSPSYKKPTKPLRQKAAFSGSDYDELSFDSDEELPIQANWKSSHVADSRHSGRGKKGLSKGLSFGSDEDLGLDSDMDDFDKDLSKRRGKGRGAFQGRGRSDIEGSSFSGSESDSDWRTTSRGNRAEFARRGKSFPGYRDRNFGRDAKVRSDRKMNHRKNSVDNDFDRSSLGGYGDNKRFKHDDSGRRRRNDKGGDLPSFKGPRRGGGFGNQQRGRSYEYEKDRDYGEFRNSRRVIER